MMHIRPAAAADDVPVLLPLIEAYCDFESIPFKRAAATAALDLLLAQPALGAGWLAVVDGAPAGYLLAVYVFSLEHHGLTAEIDELFVVPGHRGRGVGGALLDAAEEAFRQAGCTNASLQLARTNDPARAFYHRRGYADRAAYELLDKSLAAD